MADKTISVIETVQHLKKNAAERYSIKEENVHIGHMVLQAMLEDPSNLSQIDAATDINETNKSVAKRTCRLASAMAHSGLKPGDHVVIMGHNHLDISIPYFACHFEGYSLCAIDPSIGQNDLIKLFTYIRAKIIFCQKSCEEKVKKALQVNKELAEIVIFDDNNADIKDFVKRYHGTQVYYRPAVFDTSKTTAWLMLTSGTTGLPKVAIIPFDTLLNAIINWWTPFTTKFESCLAMATLQWFSSLFFFLSGPLMGYTRIQSSEQLTPQSLVALINKYRKKCGASLYMIYGMTELLAPIFDFDESTPFGSTGKPKSQYEFRLMDDSGNILNRTSQTGELWIKGDSFFKGYLNNPEETSTILTDDGWFKTGDMFYKDKQNYYYFVERKKLLIKHYGFMISPLQMEDIIRRHPSVMDACIVSLPDPDCMERPIAAVLRKNGDVVNAQEIFDLLRRNMEGKRLNGGLFFVDSLPVTPSGKVHRALVKEMATKAQLILF